MYFLSFETSTKIFSLALNKDEKVLRYRNLKTASILEDSILPAVDKILDSAGIKFSRIDGFAIALGPGSFTSLRVGLATVKAFAMGTAKPVVGIPSLDIIAHGIQNKWSSYPTLTVVRHSRESGNPFDHYDEICVITDARRGNVYACLYGHKGGALVRKSDYLLTSLDDVLKKVHGKTLFVGDAIGLYRNRFSKFLFADEKWWYPRSTVMASLAYERFESKQYDDPASLVPLYLYPQDCQVTPLTAGSSPNAFVGDLKKERHSGT
jgi:tRNA threonylcarbamoyladenosine biosynthesis protein TsaB